MPLLPTVISATVPPAYTPAPVFVFVCLGLAFFFLVCAVLGRVCTRYHSSCEIYSYEYRIFFFPCLLFITMLVCMLVQLLLLSKIDWTATDTEAVVYGGIQLSFALVMYHIPMLTLIPLWLVFPRSWSK